MSTAPTDLSTSAILARAEAAPGGYDDCCLREQAAERYWASAAGRATHAWIAALEGPWTEEAEARAAAAYAAGIDREWAAAARDLERSWTRARARALRPTM